MIYLFKPFHATRVNPSAIQLRVDQLEKENGMEKGTGKAGFWEEFEVSFIHFCKAVSNLSSFLSKNVFFTIYCKKLCCSLRNS